MNIAIVSDLMEILVAFWNALSQPLRVFLNNYAPNSTWFATLLASTEIGDFFLNMSLGGMLLGAGLLTIIVIQIVYFFIP